MNGTAALLAVSSSLWGELSVTSVKPHNATVNSCEIVEVIGTGFDQVKEVYFGSVKSPSFTKLSDTKLQAQAPLLNTPAGHVHIKVKGNDERSPVSSKNRFSYIGGGWLAYVTHGFSHTADSIFPFQISELAPPPTLPMEGFGYGLVISPNNARLYATCSDYHTSHHLNVVDIAKNQIINQIPFNDAPTDMAINLSGRLGYVIHGAVLSEINLLNSTVNREMDLPYEASQIAITPDGSKAYITHYYYNSVSVVDLHSFSTTTSLSFTRPWALAVHPDGNTVYVCTDDRIAYALNTSTDQIVLKFNTGLEPYAITINPNGNEAYIANFGWNNVYVINLNDDYSFTTTIRVGKGPIAVAVSPDGKKGYTVNYISGTVSTLDLGTHTMVKEERICDYPYGIVITPDQAPVACFAAKASLSGNQIVDFDASASYSPLGQIVKYDWAFGDGTKTVSNSPIVSHQYKQAGTYPVTLTVTNANGTSTEQVFTGKTVSRNGNHFAKVTRNVNTH